MGGCAFMRHWIADVCMSGRVLGTLGSRTYGPTVVACRDHAARPIIATDVAQGIQRCFSKNWPLGQGLQQKLTVVATQTSVKQSEQESAVYKLVCGVECLMKSGCWSDCFDGSSSKCM